MKPFLLLIIGIFFLPEIGLYGQAPGTDIYVFDIELMGNRLNYRNMVQVTDRDGYDNQPSFTPSNESLLFSSIRDSIQSDIYQYHLSSQKLTQLTATPESEYSPMVIPGTKKFSVVRVEADSSQRLWRFPLKPNGRPLLLLPKQKKVGYYEWINNKEIGLFLLPDPFTLLFTRVGFARPAIKARHIGRSLHMAPNEYAFTYVDKKDKDHWYIKKIGLISGNTTTITETIPGVEDFCWSPQGYMVMGKEGKLYIFIPGKDTEWRFMGDLEIGDFYRIAISPDGKKMAVVAYR